MPLHKIPPQLKLPDTRFNAIRNGKRGIVFRISSEYAAKILYQGNCFEDQENFRIRDDSEAVSLLEYEAEIAGFLHDYHIKVPKPIGVENLDIIKATKTNYPAYVMQYLPYPSGAELGYHEFNKAVKCAEEEMMKAMDYNFIPGGDVLNPNNFMYDRDKRISYLIDFELWTFDKESLRAPDDIDLQNI